MKNRKRSRRISSLSQMPQDLFRFAIGPVVDDHAQDVDRGILTAWGLGSEKVVNFEWQTSESKPLCIQEIKESIARRTK